MSGHFEHDIIGKYYIIGVIGHVILAAILELLDWFPDFLQLICLFKNQGVVSTQDAVLPV